MLLSIALAMATGVAFAKDEASKDMVKIINGMEKSITIHLEYYKKNASPEIMTMTKALSKGGSAEYDYKDEDGRALKRIALLKDGNYVEKFSGTDIKVRGIYTIK